VEDFELESHYLSCFCSQFSRWPALYLPANQFRSHLRIIVTISWSLLAYTPRIVFSCVATFYEHPSCLPSPRILHRTPHPGCYLFTRKRAHFRVQRGMKPDISNAIERELNHPGCRWGERVTEHNDRQNRGSIMDKMKKSHNKDEEKNRRCIKTTRASINRVKKHQNL